MNSSSKYNNNGKKSKPWSSLGTSFKRVLGQSRRPSKSSQQLDITAKCSTIQSSTAIDLPVVVWMEYIFSFLDRSEQNCLAEAHREVARARRFSLQSMNWPCGRVAKPFSRSVKAVVFSPDNARLFITYCKNKVLQYDKLSGPCLLDPIRGHAGIVADVQFSPLSGDILATASKNDGTIRLWRCTQNHTDKDDSTINTPNYKCFRILEIHQHDLRHMAWSRQGDKIVSWGNDGFLRVSDVHHGGGEVAFSHNNDRVYLWNLADNSSRVLSDLRDEYGSYRGAFVTGLTYSPDGTFLVVGCHVATIKFWQVAVAPTNAGADDADSNQQHLDYIFDKEISLGVGWSAVTLLTFTQDGRYLACSNNGSQIRIVDTITKQILITLKGHTGRIESLCFTSDGKTLASGSCDRTVRLWDTTEVCSSSLVP